MTVPGASHGESSAARRRSAGGRSGITRMALRGSAAEAQDSSSGRARWPAERDGARLLRSDLAPPAVPLWWSWQLRSGSPAAAAVSARAAPTGGCVAMGGARYLRAV